MSEQKFNTRVITVGGRIRFSYVKAFEALPMMKNGKPVSDPAFSVQILIKKDDVENVNLIKAGMAAAYQKGLKEKWNGVKPANLRSPLRDGDTSDLAKNPERKGCYFMNVTQKAKKDAEGNWITRSGGPIVVGANPSIRITDPVNFYSGCYGNISINFFPYDTMGDGVSAGLQNIQKISEGENLGGGASAPESDFGGATTNAADDFMD